MRINHDIHIHTFLSNCSSDPEQVPANMIKQAAALGLKKLGFADHLWCKSLPGASNWYRPQDEEHVLQIKEQMPDDLMGIEVLIGCESEYTGEYCGIDAKHAELFDFVLIPGGHFHMVDFVRPKELQSPEELSNLLLERNIASLDFDFIDGLAHPFYILGQTAVMDQICALLRKSDKLKIFLDKAAEKQLSLEINRGYFPQLYGREDAGFHDESLLELLSLAKAAGCLFHFSSDAHNLPDLGSTLKMQAYAEQLCIREEDIYPLFRA